MIFTESNGQDSPGRLDSTLNLGLCPVDWCIFISSHLNLGKSSTVSEA